MPGHHWYQPQRVGYPDPITFFAGRDALAEFHDSLWQRTGIGPERTVLGGFSMGSVMSFALGLDSGRPAPAGILGFSGFVPQVDGWMPDTAGRQNLGVFIAHGSHDQVISVEFGRNARDFLEAGGLSVEYHEPATIHTIDPATIEPASRWLAARLAGEY
jgi:phospholipase/carboxylesterase